ncbi:hypothetical protein AB1Y20_015398 [Prymnesium parvum]|uniref:Importin subunit alpha n=1 Tax=Prymnesium parvum TaxID=97485 RepID=A0AB34JX14_PRYPA
MGVPPNKKGVKSTIDSDDCRKQRADKGVEIRKAKRDEGLLKRRNLVNSVPNLDEGEDVRPPPSQSEINNYAATVLGFTARNGPAAELEECLNAVRALRKLLSIPNCPPIDDIINADLCPAFVTILAYPDSGIQFESAWCLTNIASGTAGQCEMVVRNNAVPGLVALLGSSELHVSEQAVWALGNIAGDCPRLRDIVLQHGAMERVLGLVQATATSGDMTPLRNACWALSNLVRGKPQPSKSYIALAVPMLARLLMLSDEELLVDVCWALSYVTDGDNVCIDLVIEAGCVPLLLTHLDAGPKLATPALRALCNIVTGSNEATQVVVDAGFIDKLALILRPPCKMQMRKEACWALSNIAAGTEQQLDAVLHSRTMPLLVERFEKDEYEVRKEAAWCVANVLHCFKQSPDLKSAQRVGKLVQMGCLKPMIGMLETNDPAMQKLMVEALGNLLSAGEELGKQNGKGDNVFTLAFDEAEGIDKLEQLQEHENYDIYTAAVALLERYFGEEDDEDQNIAPNSGHGGFAFGLPGNAAPLGVSNQPAFAF